MKTITVFGITTLVIILVGVIYTSNSYNNIPEKNPLASPTIDRLALPVLSENPTQFELGSSLYYYHCMPCHGDQGQGLTDEWREVWEEDHRNCWAKGCHSIRDQDKVFTIPTIIPPVVGNFEHDSRFSKPEDLFNFLKKTHPPQNPGLLTDDEYWALTAFLLVKNRIISPTNEIGPPSAFLSPLKISILSFSMLGAVFVTATLGVLLKNFRQKNKSKLKTNSSLDQ